MNILKARKTDYLVGIPLCLLLSGLAHIYKILGIKGRGKDKEIKKIAFIKLSELGAIILAYPLLNHIKKEYPSANFFFVTFDRNRGIFKFLGNIIPDDNILAIREKPFQFILDTLKIIWRLRKERIDIMLDLEFFSRFSAIFSYLTMSKKRIGFYHYTFEGLYRGNLLTHKILYNPLSHITKSYLSFSCVLNEKKKDRPQLESNTDDNEAVFPKYISDAKPRERLLEKLKAKGIRAPLEKSNLFLINPGEGILPLREWPLDNFIFLANLILENKDNYIIITGIDGAINKTKIMLETIGSSRCISLVGQTELDELMELFNISKTLISNDCGLAHLAMLTSIRKFVIFGPESPQVFGPLERNCYVIYSWWPCSPCLSALNHRNSDCTNNICLKTIQPQYVYNLIMQYGINKNEQ